MGLTTVIPDLDASRPATADPAKIVAAVDHWQVTQAFGSPAIWNRVGHYCEQRNIKLTSVRRILSAGAPVPADVLRRMKACIHPQGEVHTPYGATEALPTASISAADVLGQTDAATDQGAGVCVGHRFAGIEWKVIRIVDGAIRSILEVEELPAGETGELVVRGPQVAGQYVTQRHWNALSKIADPTGVWHRMGDLGYCDGQGRFWFCGRLRQRVVTASGPLDTACCEAIFNTHQDVHRSALVGVGRAPAQQPVLIAEPLPGRMPWTAAGRRRLRGELGQLAKSNPTTARIEWFLLRRKLPVDVRHNAKIGREQLAVWAARRLRQTVRE